jgi:hypothetical protein
MIEFFSWVLFAVMLPISLCIGLIILTIIFYSWVGLFALLGSKWAKRKWDDLFRV